MAVIRNIFGGPSGKIGPVVCAVYKDKAVIRSLPTRKTRACTEGERRQRDRFAQAHFFLKPFLPFIRIGFHCSATPGNAFNACKGHNLRHAVTDNPAGAVVVAARVMLSVGSLAMPDELYCSSQGQKVSVLWDAANYPVPADTLLMVAALNKVTSKLFIETAVALAASGMAEFMPGEAGDYHLWVAFYTNAGKQVTCSQYFHLSTA